MMNFARLYKVSSLKNKGNSINAQRAAAVAIPPRKTAHRRGQRSQQKGVNQ